MLKRASGIAFIALILLAGACSTAAEPVFPTPGPTKTPLPDISPTIEIIALTATPTIKAINPPVATNGASPTAVIGFIATSPRFTLTPTQQSGALGLMQIEYFAANPASIKPGDVVTLFWSVKGADKVAIYQLDSTGKRGRVWNKDRAGSLEVQTTSSDQDKVDFLLTIDSGSSHMEQQLSVAIQCSGGWFFDPQPVGCPSVTPVYTNAVEQPFEHGRMIWLQAEQRVYIFFDDGKQPEWAFYPDEYKDGQPADDPSISPPPGMIQPVRGFGLVWRSRPHVRDRLGWATQTELSFDGAIQGDGTLAGATAYLRTRDGNIIQLSDKGSSWKMLGP